jgi:hypothetical protein
MFIFKNSFVKQFGIENDYKMSKMSAKSVPNKLKTLMTGLLYPSVLGTCMVLFLYRIFNESPQILLRSLGFYYVVLMIIYFSICYLVIFYSDDRKYTMISFLLDIVEISAILYCVDLLGYYDLKPLKNENLSLFYYIMCLLPIVQLLWRFYSGEMKKLFLASAIIGCGFLLFGAMWAYKFEPYNIVVLCAVSIAVFYYAVDRLK